MERKSKMGLNGIRTTKCCQIYAILLLFLSIFIESIESRALLANNDGEEILDGNGKEDQQQQIFGECNIYENDPIHVLMDRICELCHDMFSHQQPNTRAECRSDCFRSNSFKKCLHLFKPQKTNSQKRRNRSLPPFLME